MKQHELPIGEALKVWQRPEKCTFRLRHEGKPAPKSGCHVCGNGGLFGCPHDAEVIQQRLDARLTAGMREDPDF